LGSIKALSRVGGAIGKPFPKFCCGAFWAGFCNYKPGGRKAGKRDSGGQELGGRLDSGKRDRDPYRQTIIDGRAIEPDVHTSIPDGLSPLHLESQEARKGIILSVGIEILKMANFGYTHQRFSELILPRQTKPENIRPPLFANEKIKGFKMEGEISEGLAEALPRLPAFGSRPASMPWPLRRLAGPPC